ncbi:MAG TPA: hypothetical protein VIV40_03035 [Kofleriaceae bacterium]
MAAVCPMCHRANRDSAKECDDCGYEFGQSIDTLRGLLETQLLNARAMFWVLAVADLLVLGAVVGLALTYGYVLLPVLPFIFFTYQAVRAAQKVSITKHSLRLIEQKQLPKATLVSG